MRDLVALSTLPAVWTGLGPQGIARSLADALLNTLSLDLIYVRLAGPSGEGAVEVARSQRRPNVAHDEAVTAAVAPLLKDDRAEPPATIPDPFGAGTLNIAVTRFGIGDDFGVLITGSSRANFPTEQDRLLLGVGANQTAIVVQRRRAEEQTQEQRERLRVTLASIGDAVLTTDTEGKVTFLNSVAQSLTGWTQDEAVGRPLEAVFEIINEHTRNPVENPVSKVLRQGRVVGLANHTVLIARDGQERPIDDTAAPIRGKDGEIVGCVLVFRDISEKKRAEAEVRASEERFRTLFESMDEAFCAVEMLYDADNRAVDYRFLEANPTFEKHTGFKDAMGRTIRELVPDHDAHWFEIYGKVAATGEPIRFVNEAKAMGRWYDVYAYRLGGPGSRKVGILFTDITARKRAEEAQARLAAIVESSDDAIVSKTLDGVITSWNKGAQRLFGYTAEEIVDQPITLIIPNERHDEEFSILDRLRRGERVEHFETVRVAKDGRRLDVSLTISPIRDANGRIIGASKVGHDITDRKRAEIALRESEQRFRQLADAMPQIVWTARPDGNIDYLNRRWTEFTGLPPTLGNDGWGSILHPDDARPAGERWAASVATGTPFEMEIRLLNQQQHTYRWHLVRTVAVRDESGKVVRWFGTGTDIDEQKRIEESSRYLAEASAALASVVDYESTLQKVANLAVPYFADWSAVDIAEDGSVRRLAVAHRDPEKIRLAHELMRHYPPDPQAPSGVVAVLRTGKPEIVSEITDDLLVEGAKDGQHLSLIRLLGLKSYVCVPLVVSGKTFGALTFATAESGRRYTPAELALATDLAHRAAVAIENTQLYQALRETDRRKDEFLATLAHELRNPLAPVRNALQILKMPRVDAGTVERSREMMERQVQHLVRLVDDLMDVSRVMRGKIELRREKIELASIVARAVETVQPLVDAQGHDLSVRLSSDSLLLDADPVRLVQVVGNLLTNAAKYTEPGGRIWLTAERDGDMAALQVRDNGIGVAPHMLPRIFELFVQADHAFTKAQGGLGIGLTLVKNLVELHNGIVEARSEGLGQGCEFVVKLPIVAQALDRDDGPKAGTQAEQLSPRSGKRLLVVDDNKDAADSLAMLLRLQGHEVRVAYSGMAAVEMTKTYTPDAVFMDIGMPGMDGHEAARRIREQPGLGKVVLAALTGWGQQEDRRRTAEAGFNHHLVKPPEPKAVEGVLAELKPTRAPQRNG
jgi:PAS domain S-box-containing protein